MSLEKVKFSEIYKKLESDELTPYNFYGVDFRIDQSVSVNYYLKHPHDNIHTTQTLSKVFFDIEVFLEGDNRDIRIWVEEGKHPVNALTFYNSKENKYYCYFVPPPNCKLTKQDFENHLLKEGHSLTKVSETEEKFDKYLDDNQSIEVVLFEDGLELVKAFWKKFHEIDPCILSGWNSDFFDAMYLYYYLTSHFGPDEAAKTMSKYGEVNIEESRDRSGKPVKLLKCPDWVLLDLMFAYKPRDDQ